MATWISRIDEKSHSAFPFNKFFHIIHSLTGEYLAVEGGDRRENCRVVGYAPPKAGEAPEDWFSGAIEWRFEAITSPDGDPMLESTFLQSVSVTDPAVLSDFHNGSKLGKVHPVMIINRRSGLPLMMTPAKDGLAVVRTQLDPDLTEESADGEVALFTLEGAAPGLLRESRDCLIYAIHKKEHFDHGMNFLLNIQKDKPGGAVEEAKMWRQDKLVHFDRAHWRLHPAVATPYVAGKKKDYTLNLDQVGVGYAYAHESIQTLSDIAGTVGNICNTLGEKKLGVIAYGISGVLTFSDHMLNFAQITDEAAREDPLQTLYKTMMPEIRDIMETELTDDNVTDAVGEGKSASMAWRIVVTSLHAYAVAQSASGQTDKRVWAFENMPDRQRARVSDLLSQSDEHFRSAIAVLMTPRNAEKGLSTFVTLSAEHTFVASLLAMLYPDVDGSNLKVLLKTYEAHAQKTWDVLREQRKAKIDNDGRDHHLKGAPYMINLDVARKNAARALDIDLGQPSALIRNLRLLTGS